MKIAAIVGMAALLSAAVIAQGARPPGGGGGGGGGHQGPPPGGGSGGGGNGGGHGQGNGQGGPTSRPSPSQIFDHVDTDHNGVISQSEFAAFLAHRPPPPPGSTTHQAGQNSKGTATSRPSVATLFKQADTDGNGVLSKAEFTAFIEAHRPHGGPPPTSRPSANN